MNKKLTTFVSNIPGWLSPAEGRFLEKAVKQTKEINGCVVEIGSFCGKSTIWLAKGARKVYAIDPHKGEVEPHNIHPPTYNKFITNLKSANVYNKVQPIVKTSQEASKEWNKDIKVLFIDGLHDEKNAQADFITWSKFLVDDGIVLIHDSYRRWCGSEKVAIKYILNSPYFYKIGVVGTITYGIKGNGSLADHVKKYVNSKLILLGIYSNRAKIILLNAPTIIGNKISVLLILNVYISL